MGRLEIIMGGMFSGKSTEMIRRLKRHRSIGDKILVINSGKDVRNDKDVLQTHDRDTFDCIKTNNLLYMLAREEYKKAKVVAVDETQFFTNLREFVEQALADGKYLILAGLDGDFKQQVFGELLLMIPLADEVTKLRAFCAMCRDGTPGPFSKRTVSDLAQELVGDCNMYQPVCRKHL
jgi:thymidine kinase